MGSRKKRAGAWRWRSATKVVDGVVQTKNRRTLSVTSPSTMVIERERAGRGWRHVLGSDDVHRFLSLIDDWETLAGGLHTIRLAAGSYSFGYFRRALIAVCALPDDRRLSRCYVDEGALRLFELLDVRSVKDTCGGCRRTVEVYELSTEQARAWQLLDVLFHELGHHHDTTTNRGGRVARGEGYALAFAEERWRALWPRYQRVFRI